MNSSHFPDQALILQTIAFKKIPTQFEQVNYTILSQVGYFIFLSDPSQYTSGFFSTSAFYWNSFKYSPYTFATTQLFWSSLSASIASFASRVRIPRSVSRNEQRLPTYLGIIVLTYCQLLALSGQVFPPVSAPRLPVAAHSEGCWGTSNDCLLRYHFTCTESSTHIIWSSLSASIFLLLLQEQKASRRVPRNEKRTSEHATSTCYSPCLSLTSTTQFLNSGPSANILPLFFRDKKKYIHTQKSTEELATTTCCSSYTTSTSTIQFL